MDNNGHPNLNKQASVAIVRYLLPIVAPDGNVSDYKTMASCRKWLGELAGGTTWDAEMEGLNKAEIEAELRDAPRLMAPLGGEGGSA